jgi:hypothetical protein
MIWTHHATITIARGLMCVTEDYSELVTSPRITVVKKMQSRRTTMCINPCSFTSSSRVPICHVITCGTLWVLQYKLYYLNFRVCDMLGKSLSNKNQASGLLLKHLLCERRIIFLIVVTSGTTRSDIGSSPSAKHDTHKLFSLKNYWIVDSMLQRRWYRECIAEINKGK